MQHDTFLEKISLWLDNRLDAAESTALQKHLQNCSACQQAYAAMQQVDAQLRQAASITVAPAPGFPQRVEARLARRRAARWQLWLGLTGLLSGGVLLSLLGLVVAAVSLISFGQWLLDISILVDTLGATARLVNELRLTTSLLLLGVRVSWVTMQQPLFWGALALAIGIAGLWLKLIQSVYRRTSVMA